ncbi:MAG TPA: hypothetical protein V6C58_20700, partial [Allocoleopsis sp.]
QILLKVKTEIISLLSQSLHQGVMINLPPERQSEQPERLWDIQLKIGNRQTVNLDRETNINTVFTQTNGRLLILGTVGSGKTTTMLELTLELVNHAINDIDLPIPVIFNLVDWKKSKLGLLNWLNLELKNQYNIDLAQGKILIESQQIIFCLDNLDQLDLTTQQLCIQSLNQLLEKNTIQSLIICSRLDAYSRSNTRLKVNGAIFLRPLNSSQIREYLVNARSRQLWELIKNESPILNLAKTPLFLSMMTLAFEEILIHGWRRIKDGEERKKYLFNAYIRRMLALKTSSKYYNQNQEPLPEKTRFWLSFLAKKMQQMGLHELRIHQIDNTWLESENKSQITLYYGLIWTIIIILIIGAGLVNFLWVQNIFYFPLMLALVTGGLWFYGLKLIKKFSLHFVLWINGYIPWNYTRFLNYATTKLFLQKIDHKYRFIHIILQEHFADI